LIKTGLGYDNNHNTLEKKTEINTNVLESPNCSKDNNMERKCNQIRNENELRRDAPPRRQFTTRYQSFFSGYYFSCKNFGHKAINCSSYGRNDHLRNGSKRYIIKVEVFMGQLIETTTLFLPYTTMLNVTNATTMVT
jgi:hypothetical protein